MKIKIAVVGSGLTGSIIAREFAEKNIKVDIYEKRKHIAGNCFDQKDLDSFTHRYGPHLFHTSNKEVMKYLNRFTEFVPYSHKVKAFIDGQFVPIPFSLASLELTHPSYLQKRITQKLLDAYKYGSKVSIFNLLESADKDLKDLGEFVYEKVFLGYSSKQWGVKNPLDLDKGVLNRIPISINKDTNYFTDKYQFLPKKGYTNIISNILNHKNIKVFLNSNINLNLENLSSSSQNIFLRRKNYNHIFFTGMIDELFGYKYGELEYRSLLFKESKAIQSDIQRPCLQLNYPNNYDFTRIIDYSYVSKALGKKPLFSRLVTEYPGKFKRESEDFNEAFYPLFTKKAREKYNEYRKNLNSISKVITVCGRLGTYKYLDMDDAISAAFSVVRNSYLFRLIN